MFAPAITYDLTVLIASQGADKPLSVAIFGTIDGFPGYEVTVTRPESQNKSERLVWSFNPGTKGNTPICLLDIICNESVEFSGKVP